TCGRTATARTRGRPARGKKYTGHRGPVRASATVVRYLVTGGAGFIGSHLVERLVRDGAEVTVLDDLSTGRRENLRAVRDCIRFIRGNAARLEVCRRATQGVDFFLLQAVVRTHGVGPVVLRYFNIFGPRQNLESQYGAVIPSFIAAALRQKPPVIFGDGQQTRDFTFVPNVVEANLLACHAPAEQTVG